ncbi:hypothetical protein SmJEL517_g03650 [Synchytrium microbalum]|uniref:Prefoldin subunit 3 n=1 Tax=Synchytrium microbalum TaxID=1806994 RepID=A0A507C200_9FUNG|nr:uncharacterized protein SmJEL517_g03650 [Synchytrium microbalum]TPX33451.1 hypothetical protein SmJEL517_g03650 [Synchytrium microbalum]
MSGSSKDILVNRSGIPQAPFIDDVDKWMQGEEAESTLRKFDEMLQKYKYMEASSQARKRTLEDKVPEIRKTLDVVKFIMSRTDSAEPIDSQFEVNDTLWLNAKIKNPQTVYLWLGANVMLEYPLGEAESLLDEKLTGVLKTLQALGEDLQFLREQITTIEVNIARVYNWDVKDRRTRRDGKAK